MRISHTRCSIAGLLVAAFALILLGAIPAGAMSLTTEMVSVSSAGVQGNGDSFPEVQSISASGRFVAFDSTASNLVGGDTNGVLDVFRHDRFTGRTILASVSSTGERSNGDSANGAVSSDGNLVAFDSFATNLVPGDSNHHQDVFIHNVASGETIRVSVKSNGSQGHGGDSFLPGISEDGRLVVFGSQAALVPDDTNRRADVYVHDLINGQTSRVSVSSSGRQGNDNSFGFSISADSRLVAFESFASNLVRQDTNQTNDVFIHNLATGQTRRVSVSTSGAQGNSDSFHPNISANGRFVFFSSNADNLVSGDTNGVTDGFLRDLNGGGKTTRVTVSSTGRQGNDMSCCSKGISGDGRFLSYRSFASNLVPNDTNGVSDVFLFDRITGHTIRVSVSDTGEQGNDISYNAGISEDGSWVLFGSTATNFPPGGDTNGTTNGDTFVRGPLESA